MKLDIPSKRQDGGLVPGKTANVRRSAELGGELVRIAIAFKSSAKYDAKIQYVEHRKVLRDDIAFGEPAAHFGEMIGDRLVSVASDDDCLQGAAPKSHDRGSLTRGFII